jgi:hypothetical protein
VHLSTVHLTGLHPAELKIPLGLHHNSSL